MMDFLHQNPTPVNNNSQGGMNANFLSGVDWNAEIAQLVATWNKPVVIKHALPKLTSNL